MTTNAHPHLEQSLQHDIDRLRNSVVEMSQLAEKALRDCVTAYIEFNRQLAYAVILRDQHIDEKEKEIDRLCLEFIVRQQPVAGPLRFAYGTIKINLEIERVGDYAESIARQLLRLRDRPSDVMRDGIVQMSSLAIRTFHEAIEAFVNQDAALARKTIEAESAVDAQRTQLNADLIRLFHEKSISFEEFDSLMLMVRRFERVADQARDICMEVLYMCTGEYAKHPGAEAFRVLFVDDSNSCRSQMAEAIARGLDQPKFVFSSAGLDPRPIDRATIEFMKDKGIDLSRIAPKAIHQVPNLEYYQVIVSLATDVLRAFPQAPHKVVTLEWLLDDPSSAPAGQSKAAYETAYGFLKGHIHDLVEAILGSKT